MQDIRRALIEFVDFEASDKLVAQYLESLHTPLDLMRFSQTYTIFNGCFAGGVASLAGRVHIQDKIFQNTAIPLKACSDFGSVIASHIFFAAIDEYIDRDTQLSITHRQLAQDFLIGMLKYFNLEPSRFAEMSPIDADLDGLLSAVKASYLMSQSNATDQELFSAMGFHIAAELLADREFNIIDKYLHQNQNELTQYLKTYKSGQTSLPAYQWIGLHTFVEEEHLDHAYLAAELALSHYVGELSSDVLFHSITLGLNKFISIQRALYNNILSKS